MKTLANAFALIAALTLVIGFFWADIKFRSRLEIGFFTIRKETIFWPFFYNKDEWTVLALSFLGAACLFVISFIFGGPN